MPTVELNATGAGTHNEMTKNGALGVADTYNTNDGDTSFYNEATDNHRQTFAMDAMPTVARSVTTHTITYRQRHGGIGSADGTGMIFIASADYIGTSRTQTGNPGAYTTFTDTDLYKNNPTIAEMNSGEAGFKRLTGTNDIASTYGKWDVTYEESGGFTRWGMWIPPLLGSGLFGNYLMAESVDKLHAIFSRLIRATGCRIIPAYPGTVDENEIKSLVGAIGRRPVFSI